MELATRTSPSRDFLSGLSNCIRYDSGISYTKGVQAQSVEAQGKSLFAPERGGSYGVFNDRPLKPMVQEYCVQDVVYMPKLWKVYEGRMDEFWWTMVKEALAARVKESQGKGYVSSGKHKGYGCWSAAQVKEAKKKWNGGVKGGLCIGL
jgi:exonuclease 3'-5' domain-containing protein 1